MYLTLFALMKNNNVDYVVLGWVTRQFSKFCKPIVVALEILLELITGHLVHELSP
jgi:hypothetical protein